MAEQAEVPIHIQITETFVRFYVLLGKLLDRCLDEATKASLPESEFQEHLQETRGQVAELVSTNRIVKQKIEKEYERVTQQVVSYSANRKDQATRADLEKEREALNIKALAVSDVLAVFRSV